MASDAFTEQLNAKFADAKDRLLSATGANLELSDSLRTVKEESNSWFEKVTGAWSAHALVLIWACSNVSHSVEALDIFINQVGALVWTGSKPAKKLCLKTVSFVP